MAVVEPATKRFRTLVSEERLRRPALASEAVALYTKTSPLDERESIYHAFARAPPTALFGKPSSWPGAEGSATTARLMWNETSLFVCWECEGFTRAPVKSADVEAAALASLEGGDVPEAQRTILLDDRVELFIWQPSGQVGGSLTKKDDDRFKGQAYHAFEVNFEGKVLSCRGEFGGKKAFDWKSDGAFAVRAEQIAVGWADQVMFGASSGSANPHHKQVVVMEIRWKALGLDASKEIRIGLHRTEHPAPLAPAGKKLGRAEVEGMKMIWTSWVDPQDEVDHDAHPSRSKVVQFHRPSMFGKLVLTPSAASPPDCSCFAARLLGSRKLRVLPSPVPSINECPPGSILVQAKYSSLCGSDLPYFREGKGPSCYWDRDGFCGHEVIGVVLQSKSDRFKPGDAVLALPSSYFKMHCASRQEWYKEEVYGILLKSFPVRGGFSQVYTSHELYASKMKECVPKMLIAQALGTILRLARKIGPVLGKTIVVVGEGQNGLIVTRLMAQMCAKEIIAVEPLEYRRKLALDFGATVSVTPAEAMDTVSKLTDGRGADIVIEMVGHNKSTINFCLDLVAKSGTVAAFGVPDDAIYDSFEFGKLFRKNITLFGSVVPEPGVDFPNAVKLIERGQFNTDGLITHTLPLTEVQEAFEKAADYKDGVVKMCIKFD